MYIVGTERIKGVVQLASINQTITKGQRIRVIDNDLENSDVEIALRMGYIRKQGERKKPKSTKKSTGGKHYVCKSAGSVKSPISLSFVEEEIQPGEEFMIDEESRRGEEFEVFYKNGIIEIIRAVEPPALTEKAITMSDLFDEKKKKVDKKRTSEKITKAAKTKSKIDTNEEVKVVSTTKSKAKAKAKAKKRTGPPNPSSSESVDDSGKPVVWNPSKTKVGDRQIEDATVWTPSGPKKATDKKASKAPEDITFVDKEQEQKRMESHPNLKANPIAEDDLGFVDHEQEQSRIDDNPKLKGKAKTGGEDLDFLEI